MVEQLAGITAITRALLGDPDAQAYQDTLLLTPVNTASLRVQQEFRAMGFDRMKQTYTFSNVPANTTAIGPATSPALPSDFLFPLQLWERPTGAANTLWQPIILAREQLPPTFIPGPYNGQYTFFGGKLNFLGATQALDILMDYAQALTPYAAPTDTVPIPDSTLATAYFAAAIIASADSPDEAPGFEAKGEQSLDNIAREFNRHRQRKGRRMRPYRGARIRFR